MASSHVSSGFPTGWRIIDDTTKPLVILLHGIARGRADMAAMAYGLRRRGFRVVNWHYPSRKYRLEDLADRLAALIAGYPGEQLNFVTHSMGGIVVRAYLAKYCPDNVHRIVMIGPPSQGARLADFFGNWPAYRWLYGPAGQELRQGDQGGCCSAGTPPCEFGIIAGGTGKNGYNPFLSGDNDGTVTVESTKLSGAKDFLVIPALHIVIQMMPRTIRYTAHFLETGAFTDGEPHPIP